MYDVNFDPQKLVAECVDTIRALTDSPLQNCQVALESVLEILKPHLSSEKFTQLQKSSNSFEIDVENCHDRKILEKTAGALFDIFLEKQELSYSAEQDDEAICALLETFSDIVTKTDLRIPLAVISNNNWEWMNQLLIVLQTDQNDAVKERLLSTVQVLMEKCGNPVKNMLLDTQIVISLVPLTQKTNGIQIAALKILAVIYSTESEIPLEQLDHLNVEYFRRLYHQIEKFDKSDVLEVSVNFSALLERQSVDSSAVFDPMREDPFDCSKLGIVLISELNRMCTERRLDFLRNVIDLGTDVLSKLFYENDLKVLAHVMARESINHQNAEIRKKCLSCLRLLIETASLIPDEDMQYAIQNFDDSC